MDVFPLIVTSLQVVTAVLSLIFVKRTKTFFYIYLIIILCLSALIEVIGLYYINIEKSSYFLYLIYTFFVFNLIGIAYNSVIKMTGNKLILIIPLILFNITFVFFYFTGKSYFNMVIFGAVNTSIYVLLYLRQLLLSDEIMSYKKLLPFWVSVGFLVFYLPSIPFFTLRDYMSNRDLFFILKYLIILMNLFIIYGLITCSKEEKY